VQGDAGLRKRRGGLEKREEVEISKTKKKTLEREIKKEGLKEMRKNKEHKTF